MFKKLSLILLLQPYINGFAAQPSNTEQDTNVNNETVSEEQFIAPLLQKDFFRQCYINVPPVVVNTQTKPNEELPVNIDALKVSGSKTKFIYQDEVNLTQGDRLLSADKMTYLIEQEQAIAEGNVNFVNGEVTLSADNAEANFSNSQKTLYQVDYQFHGEGPRGTADKVYDNGAEMFELSSSTYTACPPNDTTWSLDASTIYIDNANEVGSAYNAVLRIKDVPVFYFPYITYPLTDTRKTGLLFPSYSYSDTDGFSVSQPLYINITPNMDATITPTYIQNRGTKIAAEYRYLFDFGAGNVQAEYLDDDNIRGYDRYLYHWDHAINFAQNWKFEASYNEVSDDYYFNDIDTPYGDRSDNQLLQTASLTYSQENWNSELEVREFQVLGSDDTPHKVLPKFAFNWYQPLNWRSLQFNLYSEVSKFDHADDDVYTATRVHFEPKLSLPLYYNSLFINTELKYMLSYYQQTLPDNGKEDWYSDLEESTTRFIPSFKVHSGVNFERNFSFLDSDYKQTLVPQFQYLYVPYEDQSAIGTYDTDNLHQDYYGLFRDNRYSGFDRIADANQITLGISSSFFNSQGKEKMRFAVGQNYYLQSSQTLLPDNTTELNSESRSSMIAEFDVNFENNYFFHAGIEWDNENNIVEQGNTTFEKRWLHNTFAQLNYRYIAVDDGDDNEYLVNQLGTKINWPINSQWTTFVSYYHDVEYNQPYESIVGLKYQSCCWSIAFTYDNHMLAYYTDEYDIEDIDDERETEQTISINFELMGLGGVGFNSVDQGLFDYGRPFYLQ